MRCLLLLLATSAVASRLYQRDVGTILKDIESIGLKLRTTHDDLEQLQSGPNSASQAVKISQDSDAVSAALSTATSDSNATAPLNEDDSASVANAIAKLQPTIFDTLDALVGKRPVFGTAIFGQSAVPVVLQAVQNLRNGTANFSSALVPKLSPNLAKLAPLLTGNIDFHFAKTEAAYS